MKNQLGKDMKAFAQQTAQFIDRGLPRIIEVEGLRHIEKSFQNEGFTDSSVKKWRPRKTKDKRGRDLTRYRSNRVGRKGNLNRYGKSLQGRPILTGYNSGGDRLRSSWRAKTRKRQVRFFTYKPYAKKHNEGLDGMPKREMIGPSKILDKKIEKKIEKQLDIIFK